MDEMIRGGSTKGWMNCVKDDMRIKRVSMEMTSDRREWKKKTCCADLTKWDKETMMMTMAGWSSGLRSRLRHRRFRVQIPVVSRGFCDEQLHSLTSHGCLHMLLSI
jgi:hypothetical protein